MAEKADKGKGGGERRGGGRGTHGSLTKSGKVRSQTQKVPKTSKKVNHGPLKTNRSKYIRFLRRKDRGESVTNRYP